MNQPIRTHQIEQLLLNAHVEREAGVDLIEEYFAGQSSLDEITRYASELLQHTGDSKIQEAILKNLSECIVVKMQYGKKTPLGFFRKFLAKFGCGYKNNEIKRAERLLKRFLPVSDRFPSSGASADE